MFTAFTDDQHQTLSPDRCSAQIPVEEGKPKKQNFHSGRGSSLPAAQWTQHPFPCLPPVPAGWDMIHVPSDRCHRHPGQHQHPRAGRAGPELESGCASTTSASPGRPGEHPSPTAEPSQRQQPIQNQRFGERWDKKGEAAATPAPVGAHITGRPRPEPVFEGDKASSSWEFPEGFFIHGLVPSLGAEEVGVPRIGVNIAHPGNVWPAQVLPGGIQLPNQPEIL